MDPYLRYLRQKHRYLALRDRVVNQTGGTPTEDPDLPENRGRLLLDLREKKWYHSKPGATGAHQWVLVDDIATATAICRNLPLQELWDYAIKLGIRPEISAKPEQICQMIERHLTSKSDFKVPRIVIPSDLDRIDTKHFDPKTGCTFEFLKPSTSGMKIISVVLFRPPNPKNTGMKYYNGALKFAEKLPSTFPGWVLRVYFDRSLLQKRESIWFQLMDYLKTLPYVQPVLYHCPGFASKDGIFHLGYLGTMVRFHALEDKNVKVVAFRDIDSVPLPEDHMMLEKFLASNKLVHVYYSHGYRPDWLKCFRQFKGKTMQVMVPAGLWAAKPSDTDGQMVFEGAWRWCMDVIFNHPEKVIECYSADMQSKWKDGDEKEKQKLFGIDEVLINTLLREQFSLSLLDTGDDEDDEDEEYDEPDTNRVMVNVMDAILNRNWISLQQIFEDDTFEQIGYDKMKLQQIFKDDYDTGGATPGIKFMREYYQGISMGPRGRLPYNQIFMWLGFNDEARKKANLVLFDLYEKYAPYLKKGNRIWWERFLPYN